MHIDPNQSILGVFTMPTSETAYVVLARHNCRENRPSSSVVVKALLNRIDDLERKVELSEEDD